MIDLTPRTPYRQRTGILFGAVMIGHLILISAQVQSKAGVPVLEGVTFGVFSRFQGGAAGLFRGVGGTWNSYFALRGVWAENESLRQQVAALEVRLQEQRALASRADRLQAHLGLRESTALPTLAAEVIAGNSNPGLLTVTVNRGTADGVQADMAVISPKGLVGRVVGPVASHAARVQLIIDRNAAAGAVTERTRAGGVVVGVEGDPPLGMELVSNLADVARRCRRGVRRGRHVPQGFRHRDGGEVRARPQPLAVDHGAPGRRFLVARRRPRRSRACSRRRRSRPARRGEEVRIVGVIVALAAALALQTTLAGLTIEGATAVNLVLVAVIYVALAFGPVAGLMAGSTAALSRMRWRAASSASAAFRRRWWVFSSACWAPSSSSRSRCRAS